jgi:hypothetical protein
MFKQRSIAVVQVQFCFVQFLLKNLKIIKNKKLFLQTCFDCFQFQFLLFSLLRMFNFSSIFTLSWSKNIYHLLPLFFSFFFWAQKLLFHFYPNFFLFVLLLLCPLKLYISSFAVFLCLSCFKHISLYFSFFFLFFSLLFWSTKAFLKI